MSPLLWVVSLLVVGLAVMVLEVFVPSGGVLGFISIVAIVAAIWMAFAEQGVGFGMTIMGLAFVAIPSVLAVAFRWFPETPLGRRVLPPPPSPLDVVPDARRRQSLRDLVGRSGRTLSELLPWGSVDLGGVTFDAVSEDGPVAMGRDVEIVGVQGSALVVRAGSRPAVAPQSPGQPEPTEKPDPEAASPRSAVLEEFDFDRFDPPVA
jgi:membrane-bound ClpP family serine protease